MTDNLIITISVALPKGDVERARVIVQTYDGMVALIDSEVARFDATMDTRIVSAQAEQPPRAKRGRKPKVARVGPADDASEPTPLRARGRRAA
jgi:hypothetical protein